MVAIKKMNESAFVKLQKEFTAMGELIRARQEEKQAVIDEFGAESKRFFFGAISQRALASSVKKTNKELKRLDQSIRMTIQKTRSIGKQAEAIAAAQAPVKYTATLSGIVGENKKTVRKVAKKKASVKKVSKKKAPKKKISKKKK